MKRTTGTAMRFGIAALGLAVLSAMNVRTADAAVIDLTGEVDISGGYSSAIDLFGTLAPSPASLSVGDTVNLTYSFAGGQSLRLADTADGSSSIAAVSAWLGLAAGATSGPFTLSSWSIDLLGASSLSGTAATSFSGGTLTSASIHIGPFTTLTLADGDFVQFTGVSSTFVISALPTSPNSYDKVRTRFSADETLVIDAALPEPGTIALLGLGLAMAGLARKRTRA